MRTVIQSHRSGVNVVPKELQNQITSVFQHSNIDIRNYAATKINEEISLKLKQLGWSDPVRLSEGSKITITSIYDEIGLCMQTGNVGRIYADLMKLQALFTKGTIRAGIIIVPTALAARSLGGNIASLERLERELPIFSQVITMPIVLIGFEG